MDSNYRGNDAADQIEFLMHRHNMSREQAAQFQDDEDRRAEEGGRRWQMEEHRKSVADWNGR